ncbi:MAG: RND transporter, partial [Caulobacteraceae bacterium]
MRRLLPLLLTGAVALQACATTATPVPATAAVAAPAAWRTDPGPAVAIDKAWWTGFGDPVLTRLVETAVASNTDIAIAAARVDEARAQTRVSRAALLPTLDAGAGAQDARSLNAFGQPTTAYSAQPQLTFAYEVDLWGRLRDQDRAARAGLQASRDARDAVALSVAAATANGYIVLRGLDARLVTAGETLAARTEALRLAKSRADAGYTSRLELKQAEGEYQAAAQQIPTLKLAISRQENALSLLLGQAPADIPRGANLFALTQ